MNAIIEQWYFAYGSNLDRNRLESRVHRQGLRSDVCYIDNYSLGFDKPAKDGSGYAMIFPEENGRVYGVIYLLRECELTQLDGHEGVPSHYIRRTVSVTLLSGAVIDAECYFAEKVSAYGRPRREYLSHLVDGASNHGLPNGYVNWLKQVPTFD